MTDRTGGYQGGRFRKGESGNPAGRPKGSRHKTTLLAEKLLQQDAEAIVNVVVDAAKAGDLTAARIVLDRIAPARKDSPVSVELPPIETAADAAKVMGAVLASVGRGDVTPGEAVEISRVVDSFVKAHEANELDARIRALENRSKKP